MKDTRGNPWEGTQNFVEVSGVRFYGKPETPLTPEELENTTFTTEGKLHALRHFTRISDEEKRDLIGKNFFDSTIGKEIRVDEERITALLQTHGAKFEPRQTSITGPEGLEKLFRTIVLNDELFQETHTVWVRKGDMRRCVLKAEFTQKLKAECGLDPNLPLGYGNVIEITPEIRPLIHEKPRGWGETIDMPMRNFVQMAESPPSDTLIVVLTWYDKDQFPSIRSIHPGIIVPPRNLEIQEGEEFEYYKKFWENHAFVETGS